MQRALKKAIAEYEGLTHREVLVKYAASDKSSEQLTAAEWRIDDIISAACSDAVYEAEMGDDL